MTNLKTVPTRKATLQKLAAVILIALLALLFFAPPIVYAYTFGWSITADHNRWAEFGSAMSGIYAPLLGALTLVVLGLQVSIQRRLTNHQQAQDFITRNSDDLDSHLQRLSEILNKGSPHRTVGDRLCNVMTDTVGDYSFVIDDAGVFSDEQPTVFDSWSAINAILWILKMHQHPMYQHAHSTSKLKIQSYFNHALCQALDHYHWVRSKGKFAITYEFDQKYNTEIWSSSDVNLRKPPTGTINL